MRLEEILFIIMMRMMIFLTNKAFFDTDYLSSFLRIDRVDLILDKYGKILTSQQVKDEFHAEGYSPKIKQGFIDLCDKGNVKIYEINEGTKEWEIYFKLRIVSEEISKNVGEMSVIALSKAKNTILASNNLTDVCDCVEQYNLKHTTTATELVEFYKNDLIGLEEAKSYWRTMRQFGISLPKTSFENFYKLSDNPCKDFKNRKFN